MSISNLSNTFRFIDKLFRIWIEFTTLYFINVHIDLVGNPFALPVLPYSYIASLVHNTMGDIHTVVEVLAQCVSTVLQDITMIYCNI